MLHIGRPCPRSLPPRIYHSARPTSHPQHPLLRQGRCASDAGSVLAEGGEQRCVALAGLCARVRCATNGSGAWQANSKEMFSNMADHLASHTNPVAVALVEYRLSTRDQGNVKHPNHIHDVYNALRYLIRNEDKHPYDTTGITIAGHSVGAWFTLSTCMESDPRVSLPRGAPVMPPLDPELRAAIRSLVLVVRVPLLTAGRYL